MVASRRVAPNFTLYLLLMNQPLIPKRDTPVPNLRETADYVLLTGATGLLGQYLLKELLLAGVRVAVLVRPSRRLDPQDRIEIILQRWEAELKILLPRPVLLAGEVTAPQLGLDASQLAWVEEHCGSVIHNAAVVSFEEADRTREPWATNLQGTENVLALARRVGIREVHYVSTAFVCGDRQGLVTEDELDCGQAFRNAYEESKFRAEQLIRRQANRLDLTVYRPSIIAGDSATGFTSSYHGLMLYLRLLDLLVPQQPLNEQGQHETPIELPLRGDEPHDIVTVDYVARAIAALFCNPLAHGRTFHLCADRPTTFREVIDWCCQFYNSGGVVYRDDCENARPNSEFSRMFFEQARVYQRYNRCQTKFEMANLKMFYPDLHSPQIDQAMVRRFIHFGRRDRWGKARVQAPPFPSLTEDKVIEWEGVQHLRGALACEGLLGMNLLGPGGRQLTLTRNPQGQITLIQGISRRAKRVVEIPVALVAELAVPVEQFSSQVSGDLGYFA
jgi:thioester reductase-like protein